MATTVSTILSTVRTFLNDTQASQRWSDAQLIGHLNDGILEIVTHDDTAYPVRVPAQLNAGTVFQTGVLPSDGSLVKLLSVTRNLSPAAGAPGGYLPGPAIVKVGTIEVMDKQNKGWYSGRPGTQVKNWIPAGEDYQNFFVYPPPSPQVPVWVELLYSTTPPQMAALTDVIPIRDKYRFLMQLFTTGRALMQDIPQGDQPRGVAYINLFEATLKG